MANPNYTVDQRFEQRFSGVGGAIGVLGGLAGGAAQVINAGTAREEKIRSEARRNLTELRSFLSTLPKQKQDRWFQDYGKLPSLQKWNSIHPELAVTPETIGDNSRQAIGEDKLGFLEKELGARQTAKDAGRPGRVGEALEIAQGKADINRVSGGGAGGRQPAAIITSEYYGDLKEKKAKGTITREESFVLTAMEPNIYGQSNSFQTAFEFIVSQNLDDDGKLTISQDELMQQAAVMAMEYNKRRGQVQSGNVQVAPQQGITDLIRQFQGGGQGGAPPQQNRQQFNPGNFPNQR